MTEGRARRLLTRAVKEELNHLYTEAPKLAGTGCDFGLYCREHAYHAYMLSRINGVLAELVLGHYFVFAPSGLGNKTHDTGGNHAWCAIGSVVPVDLSMTFHRATEFPYWAGEEFRGFGGPVFGHGSYGAYRVTYTHDEAEYRRDFDSEPRGRIAYLEVERPEAKAHDLLANPYSFLRSPARPLTDDFGHDIFAKVTVHLDELVHGLVQALPKAMSWREAMQAIADGYDGALANVRARLSRTGR